MNVRGFSELSVVSVICPAMCWHGTVVITVPVSSVLCVCSLMTDGNGAWDGGRDPGGPQ